MILMRTLCLSLLLFTCMALPATAQNAGTADKSAPAKTDVTSSDIKERLALARDMHDVWPLRTKLEAAIQNISDNYPPEQQAQVKAAMRRAIKFDQAEEESIKAMADIYTAEELKAMIAFYGSETGRAISAKSADYEKALTPIMMQMIDKAMLDLRTGTK